MSRLITRLLMFTNFYSLYNRQLHQRIVFSMVTTVYSGWPLPRGAPAGADSGAACSTFPGTACPPWSEPAHECRLPPQNSALKKMSARHQRSLDLPTLRTWSLGEEVRCTFGVFGLLLLEARQQLSRGIVETFERLMEDPVLGLYSCVDILHGCIKLVICDASFHVPEISKGHNHHQTLLELSLTRSRSSAWDHMIIVQRLDCTHRKHPHSHTETRQQPKRVCLPPDFMHQQNKGGLR